MKRRPWFSIYCYWRPTDEDWVLLVRVTWRNHHGIYKCTDYAVHRHGLMDATKLALRALEDDIGPTGESARKICNRLTW